MSKKKKALIAAFAAAVLLASAAAYIAFRAKEKPAASPQPGASASVSPQPFPASPGAVPSAPEKPIALKYDETLFKTVQAEFYQRNRGLISEGYAYEKNRYLTATQTGMFKFSEEYSANNVRWVSLGADGKISSEALATGGNLVKIVKFGDTPFVKVGNDSYFVFYERFENSGLDYNLNGYIYKIRPDGSVEQAFKTSGAFHGAKRDMSGNFIFEEKFYLDPTGMYPYKFKPYELRTYQVQNGGKLKLLSSEQHDPNTETDIPADKK